MVAARLRLWKLVRTRSRSIADTANDAASATNAASFPSVEETRPPSAAPTTSIVPHADPMRTFARARSSFPTTLGIAAEEAGSKKAEKPERKTRRTKAIQMVASDRAARSPSARNARMTSAEIITDLRSNRSTITPAKGDTIANGRV